MQKHKIQFNKFHWILITIMITGCIVYLPLYYTQAFDINVVIFKEYPAWFNKTINVALPITSVVAGIANLFCVILLANKKISNFVYGAIAVILFAIIAVIERQWLFAVLNGLYYLPFQFVGIHTWKKDMLAKKDEIKVKSMKKKVFITILLCTLIVGAGVGLIIDIPAVAWALGLSGLNKDWIYYTSLTMNGVVLCLSIVAFQIAIHEYKENFIFWMCSNACVLLLWSLSIAQDAEVGVIIGVYTSSFTLFTYVFSAANSVFGYINWSKKQTSI